jgi:glycosyl hydrolase family 106( putative alpha-L-rhamnosidase)
MTAQSFDNNAFKYPDKSYRPAPFWSLNGDLEDKQLLQQIRDFKEIGFGGYFMHPRVGMKTPYLKEEWFDRVKFMVETGEKEDMEPWLYDEDSYPSGFASGAVPAARPDLRTHALCLVTPEQLEEQPCVVAEYGFWKKSLGDSLQKSDKTNADFAIIAARSIEGSPWHNNQCYIDTLNPETIQCFIETTHEKYAEKFRAAFGNIIPGIFTDEPHHSPSHNGVSLESLPWTPSLPEAFSQKYGYDLLDKLHCLFFDLDDYKAVRFDFFNLVNDMFVNNFCKPMFDWCEEHGLELTGHFWEHSYPRIHGQADILTPLKYMHRPGIDLLGRDVDKFAFADNGKKLPSQVGNFQMVKVATTIARQYGFNRVMSETWGGSGWDQTLEEHKQTVDWEMLLGINYVVPHLAHYSLEGYRKADYPISFTRALPYWKHLHFLNDHIARVCYAMSCGETLTQILVIHPASHNWINYNNDTNINHHAVELENLTRWLSTHQYEFDFGDETLLAEDGWVTNGEIGIAKAGYDTVIIPPTCNLHKSTLEKLQRFMDNGGSVINFGETSPQLTNGRISQEAADFFAGEQIEKTFDLNQLDNLLKLKIKRLFQIESTHRKVMSMTRSDENRSIIFLANFADETDNLTLHFAVTGRLYVADTETGDFTTVAVNESTDNSYNLELVKGESRLFIMDTAEEPFQSETKKIEKIELQQLTGPFAFQCIDPNIMLLDHCQYAFNENPYSDIVQVEKAQAMLKARYDFEYSSGVRYCREYSRSKCDYQGDDTFKMLFSFDIDDNVSFSAAKLAVEVPHNWSISVNGQKADQLTDDFFIDHCFGVITIGDYLQVGKNEILMQASVSQDLTPANMFILGDFGVRLAKAVPIITPAPEKLELGDITTQGYPFFGGHINYKIPFLLDEKQDNFILQLSSINVPIIDCNLDNKYKGKIFEAPYQLNLGCVEAGKHELQITLYSHLKNVFGPHYTKPTPEQVLIGCPVYTHIYEGSREANLQLTSFGMSSVTLITS